MAEVGDNRVAVYIDFDNIVISLYNQLYGRGAFQSDRVRNVVIDSPSADPAVVERITSATVDIGAILDYASSLGTVVISRAYADWSQPVNAGYRRQLIDRAIDLTQMFPLSATKNGADIRLAIDVVEDMFRLSDVTHVVLVAGDSDYVALAQRVKRLGRYIIAVGVAGRHEHVALYYAIDPKLVEMGLMPSIEVGKTEYDHYIRNGLQQQLYRVPPGGDVEEDHMRNRQLVAAWVYEKGLPDKVIERRVRDGKTYFVVRDYDKLRVLFGDLLRELQRIKSAGDYDAIRNLVERYAVKVDPVMHAEVLERYAKLDIPAYSGFIGPRLVPVESAGRIVDVRIEYPDDFSAQMLEYAEKYSWLPTWN